MNAAVPLTPPDQGRSATTVTTAAWNPLGSLVGYACGVGGVRASRGTFVLVSLIVVLVFIIVALDRPRRGLIEVDQSSLIGLRAMSEAAYVQPR